MYAPPSVHWVGLLIGTLPATPRLTDDIQCLVPSGFKKGGQKCSHG